MTPQLASGGLIMTNKIIQKLKTSDYPALKSGKAKNIEEFYNTLVAPMFQNREFLISWHKLLVEYISTKTPTFFIRKHGSAAKDKYHTLRRGFTSIDRNSIEYVFCDNTLCMTFVSMRLAGLCPSIEDFDFFIKSRNIQCGFGQVSEEKDFALYTPDSSFHPKLNTIGWYLAHILPAATSYDKINNFNVYADNHFPKGDQKDWSKKEKFRMLNQPLSIENITALKAHLFRLIHPFNSFLVPKKKLTNYNRGTLIGEEPNLIAYVFKKVKSLFPKEYAEFYNIAMGPGIPPSSLDYEVKDISWGTNVKQNAIQKSITKKPTPQIPLQNEHEETKTEPSEQSTIDILRKIGVEAFIYFYLPLKSNRTIPAKDLALYAPNHSNWTFNSKASRASKSKKLFNEDRVQEALELISKMNIAQHLIDMANRYLDDLVTTHEEEFEKINKEGSAAE